MKSIATSFYRLFLLISLLAIHSMAVGQDVTPETSLPASDLSVPVMIEGEDDAPAGTYNISGPATSSGFFSERPSIRMVDRIVVIVNNDVITAHELNKRVDYVTRQLAGRGVELPPREMLENQLLDRMILEKLQVQRAQELGAAVNDEQLNEIIQRIIDSQSPGSTIEAFQQSLEESGIDFDYFKEDLRKEVLISVVREQEIDSKIQVTNEEVENFLINQQHEEEMLELNLSHIIVSLPDETEENKIERSRKEAAIEQIMRQLADGTDFSRLAMDYSESQDAMDGGSLGWRAAASLPLLYVEAVTDAQEGQVVGPLRSVNGIHFVQLNGRRMGGMDSEQVAQYEVRHILLRPDEGNSIDVIRDRLQQIRQMLLANPDSFPELARQYSQDASGTRGGSIGWVSPGDTVPPFEAVVVNLPIGQISEPVETMYGWHLIQVTDTRMADMTDSRQRTVARRALKDRKVEETYQQWLRELRDEAFVEYKERDDID